MKTYAAGVSDCICGLSPSGSRVIKQGLIGPAVDKE